LGFHVVGFLGRLLLVCWFVFDGVLLVVFWICYVSCGRLAVLVQVLLGWGGAGLYLRWFGV
jgi:hypothetical protein